MIFEVWKIRCEKNGLYSIENKFYKGSFLTKLFSGNGDLRTVQSKRKIDEQVRRDYRVRNYCVKVSFEELIETDCFDLNVLFL